jgi:hypothetical protein
MYFNALPLTDLVQYSQSSLYIWAEYFLNVKKRVSHILSSFCGLKDVGYLPFDTKSYFIFS